METRITAPRVAAAIEYKKPPPKILSCTKTQPPIKEPTRPRIMSAMQPKPRPRAIFPASQPAIKPTRSHQTNPCDSIQTPKTLCASMFAATMKPPRGRKIVSEFLFQARSMAERIGGPSGFSNPLPRPRSGQTHGPRQRNEGTTRILTGGSVAAGSCSEWFRGLARDRGREFRRLRGLEKGVPECLEQLGRSNR